MKKAVLSALLLGCLAFALCAGAEFPGATVIEAADNGAVSVACARPRALPAYTGGSHLWYYDDYRENALFTFTALEPLTDVAFCSVDFDVKDGYIAGLLLGNVLWKLPDMAPGDTASVYCSFDTYDASCVAIRYKDTGGQSHGIAPRVASGLETGDRAGALALLTLSPRETGEPVDRAAVEAEVNALYEAHGQGDLDALGKAARLYLSVLDSDPWASWAYLGYGKVEVIGYGVMRSKNNALGALNAAISLGETGAEVYYLRALALGDVAEELYGYAYPGDAGWPMISSAVLDIERAIATKPGDFPYDCHALYGRLLGMAGRTYESNAAMARSALLADPEDEAALRDLYEMLNLTGQLDEAAALFPRVIGAQPDDAAALPYLKADEAFEAGDFPIAVILYTQVTQSDLASYWNEDYPPRVWYRLIDAYAQIGMQEAALDVFDWGEDYGFEAPYPTAFYVQKAEILLELERIGEAKGALSEALYDWNDPKVLALAARIDVMLPADARKVFEGPEWAGYEPVATKRYEWSKASSIIATVMRRGEHNVLCVLKWDDSLDGYRLVVQNDRAVYQGDRVPALYIDDAFGSIYFEYTDDAALTGYPAVEGYTFCTRWYWEEETEQTAVDDWDYTLLNAYREYPEAHDPGSEYYETARLSLGFVGNKLRLMGWWESYDGYVTDERELLAETDMYPARYSMTAFDIGRLGADFDAMMAETDTETLLYYIDHDAWAVYGMEEDEE